MDMSSLSIVNLAKNKLDYLVERQKIVATNIANVDTPGYVAQDLEEPDFAGIVKKITTPKMQMVVTNPNHIVSAPVHDLTYQAYVPKPDTALTIDGNGVSIEDELNKASKIQSEHERVLTIYNKYKTMLQTANRKVGS